MQQQRAKYSAKREMYLRRRKAERRMTVISVAAILTFLTILLIVVVQATSGSTDSEDKAETLLPISSESLDVPAEVSFTPASTTTKQEDQTTEEKKEPEFICIGTYKLTAYCSCEKCCGYWATVRPIGEDGKPIVYTASGAVAQAGITVAADTTVLPFGTVVVINGHEYTVQDRGGAIKGNRIDVYFDDHQEALIFGVQYAEVYVKGGN